MHNVLSHMCKCSVCQVIYSILLTFNSYILYLIYLAHTSYTLYKQVQRCKSEYEAAKHTLQQHQTQLHQSSKEIKALETNKEKALKISQNSTLEVRKITHKLKQWVRDCVYYILYIIYIYIYMSIIYYTVAYTWRILCMCVCMYAIIMRVSIHIHIHPILTLIHLCMNWS